MTELQHSILAIVSALVILLATLIVRSADDQAEKARVVQDTLLFTPSAAYEKARELATRFPKRAMGTDDGKAAATWIEAEMKRFGLRTRQQELSAWIAGERIDGQNVIGIHDGLRDEAIVIIAHYDIPFHVREGAMDDASGVAVMLELVRVLSQERQKKSLVFVASDGEDWGMLGARRFVEEYPDPTQIRAAISLDYVRLESPEKVYIGGEGQFRGQVPLWLWILAEDCISRVSGEPKSLSPPMQYISQTVNISSTDQGPFLRVGVPALNLGGNKSDSPLAQKVYHTPMDTSENLKPELFDVYGRASELLIRSLDALDYSMDNNPYYLRTGTRTFIGRSGLVTLQIFLFLPLLLATSFQYYNLRTRENFMRAVFAELGNICLFMLPWLLTLAVLYLLVWTNFIPRYELYPATPLDPFLSSPHWKALAIVVCAFVIVWAGVWFVRRFPLFRNPSDFAISKAVCLDALFTLCVIALILNGFAASFFLAPAALLCVWIERDRRLARRMVNAVLLLVATLPIVLVIFMFSERLMLGPFVFWYLLLGVGYRFFSPAAVLIAVGASVVVGRLLQKSLEKDMVAAESETQRE